MKKIILAFLFSMLFLVGKAQSSYKKVYERVAYSGERGGEMNLVYDENKKGKKTYYMMFQSYKYNYVKDLKIFKIGKEANFNIFIKNLNTVMNVWDFKPEFKEGRGYSSIGYTLNVYRDSPDNIKIGVDLNSDGVSDDFVILSKEEVTDIYNKLIKIQD